MKIVLIWIQWAWKWTQRRILKQEFWFDIFETWWKIREIASQNTTLWKKVKNTIESWNLVSIDLIWEIIKDYLNSTNQEKIIFDWIPRNLEQKYLFDSLVKDFKVLHLKLDEKEAYNRLLNRKYNPKTWETFPPHIEFDPKTNEKLIQRTDDNKEAIKKRIDIFFAETQKVIDEYKKEWKLIEIDASKNIDEINLEIRKKLWIN